MTLHVECPSCMAPYKLDPKRVPAAGVNMRCPKCGASFRVHPTGEVSEALPKGASRPNPNTSATRKRPEQPVVRRTPPGGQQAQERPIPKLRIKPTPAPMRKSSSHDMRRPSPGAASDSITPGTVAAAPASGTAAKRKSRIPSVRVGPFGSEKPVPPPPPRAGRPPHRPIQQKVHTPKSPDRISDLPMAQDSIDLPAPVSSLPPTTNRSDGAPEAGLPKPQKKGASNSGITELDRLWSSPKESIPAPPRVPSQDPPTPAAPAPAAPFPSLGTSDKPVTKAPPSNRARAKPQSSSSAVADTRGSAPATSPGPKPPPPVPPTPARAPSAVDLPAPVRQASVDPRDRIAARAHPAAAQQPDSDDASFQADLDLLRPAGTPGVSPARSHDLPRPVNPSPPHHTDLPALRSDHPPPKVSTTLGMGGATPPADLPAPVTGTPKSTLGFGELDLPAVKGAPNDPPPRPSDVPPLPIETAASAVPGRSGNTLSPLAYADTSPPPGQTPARPEAPPNEPPPTLAHGAHHHEAHDTAQGGAHDFGGSDIRLSPDEEMVLPRGLRKRARPGGLRWVVWLAVALMLLAGTGFALRFTPLGLFGRYHVERFMPEAQDSPAIARALTETNKAFTTENYEKSVAQLQVLQKLRESHGLHRELLAQTLLFESILVVRYGDHPGRNGIRDQIAAMLSERRWNAPNATLAHAWHELALGNDFGARKNIQGLKESAFAQLLDGELLLKERRPRESKKAFDRARRAGLKVPGLWGKYRANRLAKQTGSADTAGSGRQISTLYTILDRQPGHVAATVALAREHLASGRADDALTRLKPALAQFETPGEDSPSSTPSVSPEETADLWGLYGDVLTRRGALDQARQAYARALGANQGDVASRLGLANLLRRDADDREALKTYNEVLTRLRSRPVDALGNRQIQEAQLGLVEVLTRLNKLDEAQDTMDALEGTADKLTEDQQHQLIFLSARLLTKQGRFDQAESKYLKAIETRRDSIGPWIELSHLRMKAGDQNAAKQTIRDAEAQVPDSAEKFLALAELHVETGEPSQAIAKIERALAVEPDNTRALFAKADAQSKSSKPEDAIETLERIPTPDAGAPVPGLALAKGLLQWQLNDLEAAQGTFEGALKQQAHAGVNVKLLAAAAGVQIERSRPDLAKEHLDRAEKASPNDATVRLQRGRLAMHHGRVHQAQATFQELVDEQPENAEYGAHLAWAFASQGKLNEAERWAAVSLENDPEVPLGRWVQGQLLLKNALTAKAVKHFEELTRQVPHFARGWVALGDAYEQAKRWRPAVKAYEGAVRRRPDNAAWHFRLARTRLDADMPRGAAEDMAKAISLAQNHVEHGKKQPTWFAEAHRLLGDAHRMSGGRAAAVETYERYLELAGQEAIDRREVEGFIERLR